MPQQPEADVLEQQGKLLLDLKKIPQAREKFQHLLALDAHSAAVHWGLGLCYHAEQKPEQALTILEKGLGYHPFEPALLLTTIFIASELRKYELALELAEKLVRQYPHLAESWESLANVLMATNSKNYSRLREAASEALRLEPHKADSHALLAEVEYHITKKSDSAKPHYQKALEIEPNSATLHYNFGRLLLADYEAKDALSHFKEALRIDPTLKVAETNLILALASVHPLLAPATSLNRFMTKGKGHSELGYWVLTLAALALTFALFSLVNFINSLTFHANLKNITPYLVFFCLVTIISYFMGGPQIYLWLFKKGWIQ